MPEVNKYHDVISERVVLGFLLQYGRFVLPDIEASLQTDDFFSHKNQSIYACLKHIISETDSKTVTIDAVLTAAKTLNLTEILNQEDIQFLKLCKQQSVNKEELGQFVRQVKFWSIIRKLSQQYNIVNNYFQNLTGNESLSEVIASTESIIFDFIPNLLQEDEIVELGSFSKDYIEFLAENPMQMAGLPSGFPNWDHCIGGGLRRGTVNILGARPKQGKSFFCLNVAKNLAEQNVPVLYLDTELNKQIQSCRWVALNSKIDINLIETGQFTTNVQNRQILQKTFERIENYPFFHTNIVGKKPDEIVSIMRRWISKNVGRDENGKTKDCLIILDYLKTMDIKDLGSIQEYQYLGDVMTKLHNFAVKYDIPILSAIQLNRDGISRDTSDAVSGSDRILWLCSNLTYLKEKTQEDVAAGDLMSNGRKKLVVIDSRFGEGMDASTTYINIIDNLNRAELVEGRFNYEITEQEIDLDNADETEEFEI